MNLPITLEGAEPEQGRADVLAELDREASTIAASAYAQDWDAEPAIKALVRRALAASSAAPKADLRAAPVESPKKRLPIIRVGLPDGDQRTFKVSWIEPASDGYQVWGCVREPESAATSAAMTLHDAIMNLPSDHGDYSGENGNLAYKMGHRDARHAAAQLAAVAAPPADHKCLRWIDGRCQQCGRSWGAPRAAVAAPDAREAGGERSHLGNQAADDSLSAPSAVPLSEPSALDQGARPVRPLTDKSTTNTPDECPKCGLEEWDHVYEPGRVSPSFKHCQRCDTQWSAQ